MRTKKCPHRDNHLKYCHVCGDKCTQYSKFTVLNVKFVTRVKYDPFVALLLKDWHLCEGVSSFVSSNKDHQ